jgi:hypothetical protein
MSSASTCTRTPRRNFTIVGLAVLVTALVLEIPTAARADSTPVGSLPGGTVTEITTSPNQFVAVALPHASKKSGLSWRLARQYDSSVVRQISEADIGTNVVLVFKVTGRGKTSLVFALTRGDTSPKAVKAATHTILSR